MMPNRAISSGDSVGLAFAIIAELWPRVAFVNNVSSLWLAEQPSAQNASSTGTLDCITFSAKERSVISRMVFGEGMDASKVVQVRRATINSFVSAAERAQTGFNALHQPEGESALPLWARRWR